MKPRSNVCVAVWAAFTSAGPPAKKFAPPPIAVESAVVGRPAIAPYWTAVNFGVFVQLGGACTWARVVAPAPFSAGRVRDVRAERERRLPDQARG